MQGKLIFIGVSCLVAFFVGGHVYKKSGAMLAMWKHIILPLSLVVEPYIYAYRFQESTKPVCARYRHKVILSFVASYLLFSPFVGLAFTAGYFFEAFLLRNMLKPSKDNISLATNLFADFVKPDMEDELAGEITAFYFEKMTGVKFRY